MIEGSAVRDSGALYAYQLDGKGGSRPITDTAVASTASPFWLHLDYAHPVSADWLDQTALLPDEVREALTGESTRPRIWRLKRGTMLTLRCINTDSEARPDQLVVLRIYITDHLIISTQHRQVGPLQEVLDDLQEGSGPTDSGSWLVEIARALTDHVSEFIEELHDSVIELEDNLLEQQLPEQGVLTLLRKQLIVMRRYMAPQREVFSRLATERLSWTGEEDRHRMQEVADQLGRGLEDLDGSISRTTVLTDEISALMADSINRRTYTMSLMAMIFLPTTFLTGLFGVNLGGIPGSDHPWAFATFFLLLLLLVMGGVGWFKRTRWL